MSNRHEGFVVILSAPSGAGKSTLARHLAATLAGVRISVSTTTRQPRPGERNAVHYYFTEERKFQEQVQEGAFLEWAQVFGNYYGTARQWVMAALDQGEDVLLDIDWQGARQVRENLPKDRIVSIFILPPSREVLVARLRARKSDDPSVIARRMSEAQKEMSHWHEYDYLLVNEALDQAKSELTAIVTGERLRRERSESSIRQILKTFQ